MNYKMVLSILGKVLLIEAVLLLFPMLVGFIYGENTFVSFLVPILALIAVGAPLSFLKKTDNVMYVKEGFVTVALAWIIMSLIGAVPFVISGEIPNYIDAVFETVSGFTTTGASILSDVEILSKSMMFWRLFTHWIGGMGILVFVLALIPGYNSGVMHVFRAESPGPTVGKFVSKLSYTAKILYGIYFVMTVIQIIMLVCGGNGIYDSVLISFSTAGTGGFGFRNDSMASFNTYSQMVTAVFMCLFAFNFNFFYLILIKNFSKAFKGEEVRAYVIAVVVSTFIIAFNILSSCVNFGDALVQSFFQVASISSTTGFSSANFDAWPDLSKGILLVLTIIGACGGSTGGGIKFARLGILIKSSASDFKRFIHPRAVVVTKFEGEPINVETIRNVRTYFLFWVIIVILSTLLLNIDAHADLFSDFSATLACIGNVGPGFGAVGPLMNYGAYSGFSKIVLSAVMLLGRLEIFPILILFAPRTWKRG